MSKVGTGQKGIYQYSVLSKQFGPFLISSKALLLFHQAMMKKDFVKDLEADEILLGPGAGDRR